MRLTLSKLLALVSAIAALALATSPAMAADPVVAAAGDIACDPLDPDFNGGDGTTGACRQDYTSNQLVGGGLGAVLPLGDNQYEDATLPQFQASYSPGWGRVKSITRPVLGNHERDGNGYFDYFNGIGATFGPAGQRGKGYYSYDVGTWHLIALNTNDKCTLLSCRAGSEQERWLRADLEANRKACTLAYWHEPLFSSKSTYSSGGDFWEALHEGGAEIVLNGHVHNYERFAPQNPGGQFDPSYGIRQFVVGTGGRNLESSGNAAPNSEARIATSFGVLKLTLAAGGYEWRFLTEGGKLKDFGTGACHDPPPAPAPPPPPPPRPVSPSGALCTVVGTPGNDVLTGTRRKDVICGFGGHDRISAGAGDDVISGGAGNDVVLGNSGNDRIYGEQGNDRLRGGSGDDRISGGTGGDRLWGNSGADRLWDRSGRDRVFGNSGNDRIVSSNGRDRDVLDGGSGRDRGMISARDSARGIERLTRAGGRARR